MSAAFREYRLPIRSFDSTLILNTHVYTTCIVTLTQDITIVQQALFTQAERNLLVCLLEGRPLPACLQQETLLHTCCAKLRPFGLGIQAGEQGYTLVRAREEGHQRTGRQRNAR